MAKAFERFTAAQLTSVIQLNVPAGAHSARLQCVGGDLRYRLDGVNPTATTGNFLRRMAGAGGAGGRVIVGQEMRDARIIRNATDTPALEVEYDLGDAP